MHKKIFLSFLFSCFVCSSLLSPEKIKAADTLKNSMEKTVQTQDRIYCPETEQEEKKQLEQYYQAQRHINALERQTLTLKAENLKLKEQTKPKPPTEEEQEQKRHQQIHLAFERKNEEIKNFCRNLLWRCQLPHHKKGDCQKFTANCRGLEATTGPLNIHIPVDLPLGETEKFAPVGYVSPDGIVKGVHKHKLGYVFPGDIDSALMMAATANLQNRDLLPDSFPKNSPAHPYRATPEERQKLHDEIMPQRNRCGLLLDQCITLNTESAECFSEYNTVCARHIPYLTILKNLRQEAACANYKINNNHDPLKRLQLLRDCGRDPTDDPENTSYMAVTDCHSLNLLCQVKQNKMPYCEAFLEGECLSDRESIVKQLLPHRMPFWEKPGAARSLMAHPQTNWPDCSAKGNVLVFTPNGDLDYYLGRISDKNFLSIYTGDTILRNIGQINPKGHFIKTRSLSSEEKNILSHFKKIERIAADGTVWFCGRDNKKNKIEDIRLFLTPKGGLFKKKSVWSGELVYDDKLGFQKAEIQNMQKDTQDES